MTGIEEIGAILQIKSGRVLGDDGDWLRVTTGPEPGRPELPSDFKKVDLDTTTVVTSEADQIFNYWNGRPGETPIRFIGRAVTQTGLEVEVEGIHYRSTHRRGQLKVTGIPEQQPPLF